MKSVSRDCNKRSHSRRCADVGFRCRAGGSWFAFYQRLGEMGGVQLGLQPRIVMYHMLAECRFLATSMRFPASGNSKGPCADLYGAIQLQEGRISPDMATELPNGSLGTSLEELLGNGTGMVLS